MNINPNVSNIPDNPEISNQEHLQKIRRGEVKSFKLGGTRDSSDLQKEINALKELIANPEAGLGDIFKKMMQLSQQLEGMEGSDALKEILDKIGNAVKNSANASSIGEAFKFRMEAAGLCEELEKLAGAKGSTKPFGM